MEVIDLLIKEIVEGDAVIRVHNDYFKNSEESLQLLEQTLQLVFLEVYGSYVETNE